MVHYVFPQARFTQTPAPSDFLLHPGMQRNLKLKRFQEVDEAKETSQATDKISLRKKCATNTIKEGVMLKSLGKGF